MSRPAGGRNWPWFSIEQPWINETPVSANMATSRCHFGSKSRKQWRILTAKKRVAMPIISLSRLHIPRSAWPDRGNKCSNEDCLQTETQANAHHRLAENNQVLLSRFHVRGEQAAEHGNRRRRGPWCQARDLKAYCRCQLGHACDGYPEAGIADAAGNHTNQVWPA